MPTLPNREIPRNEKIKILKYYLDRFWVKADKKLWEEWKKRFPRPTSAYVQGTQPFLRQIGCFFLMQWGYQVWRCHYTHELVDAYLGNKPLVEDDDGGGNMGFCDDSTPFLILYHMAATIANRQLEPMVIHCVSQRNLEGMLTLVLVETPIVSVKNYFRDLELPIIEATTKGPTQMQDI